MWVRYQSTIYLVRKMIHHHTVNDPRSFKVPTNHGNPYLSLPTVSARLFQPRIDTSSFSSKRFYSEREFAKHQLQQQWSNSRVSDLATSSLLRSFTDEPSSTSSVSHANTSSDANDIFEYRVGTTNIVLGFQFKPIAIDPGSLGQTLQKTQIRLRLHLAANPLLSLAALLPVDNPYESLPVDSHGAFFGVAHNPWYVGPPSLTYGMVDSVLTGVTEVLVEQRRCDTSDFWVKHDRYGFVGLGRVTETKPMARPGQVK